MAGGPGPDGEGTKSPLKIMANIFISFIGAGVLGLPFAFKEAGILEGITIMTLVGITSVKAMLLLIDCKHHLVQKTVKPGMAIKRMTEVNGKKDGISSEEKLDLLDNEESMQTAMEPTKPAAPGQHLTYGDVGYYAIGYTGTLMVDACIIVSQMGFCCAYLIFISENLSDYIRGLQLHHWLLILLPPLYMLTLIRSLSTLAISSLFAQLSNLLAFAVVFWFDFEHFHQVGMHPREFSLEGFPFFLAVAMYCYEGAGMILSLEASLHTDVRHTFKSYFKKTIFVVTFLYITFGASGYLSFGDDTNAIITLNLPKGVGVDFAMVVKSCLCLALFFTYPVMMFPVIKLLEKRCFKNTEEMNLTGNILRAVMVMLTGIVVTLIPNFANLMALVGATCCTLLAFIMPGLFHMRVFKGSLSKCDYVIDISLIIIGVVGAVVGTWDALARMNNTSPNMDFIAANVTHNLANNATVPLGNTSIHGSVMESNISLKNANTFLYNSTISLLPNKAAPLQQITTSAVQSVAPALQNVSQHIMSIVSNFSVPLLQSPAVPSHNFTVQPGNSSRS